MIKIILSIFISLIVNTGILYGQVTPPTTRNIQYMSVIDSGKIRISYAFNATDIKDYKTYDDLQLLEIGATVSKYYSFFISNSDSLVTDRIIKNPNSRAVPYSMGIRGKDSFWSEYYYSEYYKDFTANTVTEYARMPKALEKANAYYEEKIPALNWEIYADTFTVITYLCQKATCHFRGRDYVAWFTLDIPINNGPWKFGGLPGLILKISDTGKRCDFECIGIEQAEQKFPIKKYPEYETKYEKKDRKKILNFQKEIHEDYYKVAGLVPVWGGKPYQKRKYEPIELE